MTRKQNLQQLVTHYGHVLQQYLPSPYACDEGNMQGVSGTGTDEAHCESDPHCWNGTELQHLATLLLWHIPKIS